MYIYIVLLIIIVCVYSADDLDNNNANTPQGDSVQTNSNQNDGHSVISRNIIRRGLGHIVYGSYGSEPITTTQQSDTDGFVQQASGSEEKGELVDTGKTGGKSGSEDEESEEEEENFDVKEVSGEAGKESEEETATGIQGGLGNINPELSSTMFIGSDDKGNSFPMDITHYYLSSESCFEIRLELVEKLIKIKHNNKTVWKHEKDTTHPVSVIFKKMTGAFIIIFEFGFIACKYVNGTWKQKRNNVPPVRLFNVNYANKLTEIEPTMYKTEYSEGGHLKFNIGHSLLCTMIKVEDHILWEKEYSERRPIFVICHYDGTISIAFRSRTYIYICENGTWKLEKSIKTRKK